MENQSEPGSCLSNRLLARSFLNNKASDLLILVLIQSTCILSDPVRYHSIFRISALNLKFPCYAISSSGLRLQTSRWATTQPVNDHRVHWELGHAYLRALSLSTFLSMNNRCFYIPIAPYSSLKQTCGSSQVLNFRVQKSLHRKLCSCIILILVL